MWYVEKQYCTVLNIFCHVLGHYVDSAINETSLCCQIMY